MSTSDLKVLNGVFSKNFINLLIDDPVCALWKLKALTLKFNIVLNENTPLISCSLDGIYKKMLKEYRTEYIYKNAIAEKIVKGKHKLSKNCYFDTEFRVNSSIADVIISNGTTVAYEIKTEYDSFTRLFNQLSDYSKVFDKVYVVMPDHKYELWSSNIDPEYGIMTLSKSYTLKTKREAQSNISKLDKSLIFSCLRRDEYINIFKTGTNTNEINVKPIDVKKTCKDYFLTLSNEKAHDYFNECLKKRNLERELLSLSDCIPNSLTSVVLTTSLSNKRKGLLIDALIGNN
ncbi:sce7726 family protein [Yokenella regensburgei]|uniref:sce7726 family protein n=1 Tax=Yokenella regensburgei TaxID=158877 RepID=UPI003F17CC46